MKICYVADGASIHTQKWVNYFAKNGHEVHLICWKAMSGYDENIRIHLLTRLVPRIWAVSQYLSFLFWINQVRRLINRIKPDIVDGHFITVYGFLAACSGFHPLVVSAWGSDILIQPNQNLFLKAIAKYALNKADAVIYNSEPAKEALLGLGVTSGKIKKILNGVDTQQFNPQQKDEKLKNSLGVPAAPTVMSIRSFKPVYNVEMLIRAIPLVLEQVRETKFVIAGDGEQRKYLENLAASLGISNSIRFIGWIPHDELPKYLASSDIYVSTSVSDSTPLSLQEAMACELAPTVTDIPANHAWIKDGKNGFIVPINDTQMLADRITYLIRHESVRRDFGKANRRIIREKAEYETEMAKMEMIYQGLIGEIAS